MQSYFRLIPVTYTLFVLTIGVILPLTNSIVKSYNDPLLTILVYGFGGGMIAGCAVDFAFQTLNIGFLAVTLCTIILGALSGLVSSFFAIYYYFPNLLKS